MNQRRSYCRRQALFALRASAAAKCHIPQTPRLSQSLRALIAALAAEEGSAARLLAQAGFNTQQTPAAMLLCPHHRQQLAGEVIFAGIASGSTVPIGAILLSIDDADWTPVQFVSRNSPLWGVWAAAWQPPVCGEYLVRVVAADTAGQILQSRPDSLVFTVSAT